MANLSASIKANRQNLKHRLRNNRTRKEVRNTMKKLLQLVKKGELEAAEKLIPAAYKAIDIALKKNLLQKNTAARRKSKLAKAVAKAKEK